MPLIFTVPDLNVIVRFMAKDMSLNSPVPYDFSVPDWLTVSAIVGGFSIGNRDDCSFSAQRIQRAAQEQKPSEDERCQHFHKQSKKLF